MRFHRLAAALAGYPPFFILLVTIVIIAIMASHTEADISVEVSRFLADENTTLEDRLGLIAYLKASPTYSKPTSYISNIEQRLELLREIRQDCEKHDCELDSTAVLWSALMVVPLERLRSLRDCYLNNSLGLAAVLDTIASRMPMLLKVCMLPYQFTCKC
jgi:hypothetical protein